uniref:Uncharacterized protein n=1 Tax=viral metagenome TaxID=1070528 RepID=A0A6M3IMF9_9ZZZZ
MDTATALALASLALGGGVGGAMLKALFAHEKKHVVIDDRIDRINEALERGHDRFERIVDRQTAANRKLDAALIALRELLIHEKLRKPGEGINGEKM